MSDKITVQTVQGREGNPMSRLLTILVDRLGGWVEVNQREMIPTDTSGLIIDHRSKDGIIILRTRREKER